MPGDVVYTHGHHQSVLRSHRWRTVENSAAYLMARLRGGQDLLDVGCGPGTITVDLARRVAPGRVIGVDASADVIAEARTAAIGKPVEFRVGNAYAIDEPDGSFDVVHAHQVLQHLAEPVTALAEMRRVCRPKGVVAARDSDYGAFAWWPESSGLERWLDLYRRLARANGGEPDAGRRLLSWARQAGFRTVEPSASVWCFATPEDRSWWGGLWADRVTESAFADQARASGLASEDELAALADAWREWAAAPDGWIAVPHGEVVCGV
jgi:ubiquinone/menaquinone biosynthesis C-methylase UbiE